MKPMKKALLRVLALAVLFALGASGAAMAADEPDYVRNAPTGIFQAKAADIVKSHNVLLTSGSLPFYMGSAFPNPGAFDQMKNFSYVILMNTDYYRNMSSISKQDTEIDKYIKAYDQMMEARTKFFEKTVGVMENEEKFRNNHRGLRETVGKFENMKNDLFMLASHTKMSANSLKKMKKDHDELKDACGRKPPDPMRLSKDNVIRVALEKGAIRWPLVKDDIRRMEFNKLYEVPWFDKEFSKVDDKTKNALKFWDKFVQTELKPYDRNLESFERAVKAIEAFNRECGGLGWKVRDMASRSHAKDVALKFGLQEAMIKAGVIEEGYFRHFENEQVPRAKRDIEALKKFYENSVVRSLRSGQYDTYYGADGGRKNTMEEALMSFGKMMKEYQKNMADAPRS